MDKMKQIIRFSRNQKRQKPHLHLSWCLVTGRSPGLSPGDGVSFVGIAWFFRLGLLPIWECFIFQLCNADGEQKFEGKEGKSGNNRGQDTYLCVLLIVHMSEEVKHGPTNGVAVFAPVIASIIILIGSNGLIRLLSSWLEALSRLGALSMGILIVYLWFLDRGNKPTLKRNSRQSTSVLPQKKWPTAIIDKRPYDISSA